MTTQHDVEQRIVQIEAEITELSARLPKHSVPPTLLMRLEELEEILVALKSRQDQLRVHNETA